MAGRRWKAAVGAAATALEDVAAVNSRDGLNNGGHAQSPVVVLGGPANSYTHYITTEEEYGIQRYEGASTLYGPHTLAAYINVTLAHMRYLADGAPTPLPQDPTALPPDNSNRSLSFIPGVVRDGAPLFKKMGEVLTDVERVYQIGAQVRAVFVGANPRNNLRLERTFSAVERLDIAAADAGNAEAQWTVVRDDSDWGLVYNWRRTSEWMGTSEVEIVWETEDWAEPGVYRLHYYGDKKNLGGSIEAFEGTSSEFTLV
jgi:neutral ceramidase